MLQKESWICGSTVYKWFILQKRLETGAIHVHLLTFIMEGLEEPLSPHQQGIKSDIMALDMLLEEIIKHIGVRQKANLKLAKRKTGKKCSMGDGKVQV